MAVNAVAMLIVLPVVLILVGLAWLRLGWGVLSYLNGA